MNPIQALRALHAFYCVVTEPKRLDVVLDLADSLNEPELMKKMADEFRQHPKGAWALENRPMLGEINIERLLEYPEGSFGREFGEFLTKNGLDPKDIRDPDEVGELGYMHTHLRRSHDIWHVATGFSTDEAGELGLQAFYLAQFEAGLSLALLAAGMLNTMFFAMETKTARMNAIALGWQMGKDADLFFGTDWASMYELPLSEVRAQLGIKSPAFEALKRETPSRAFASAAE